LPVFWPTEERLAWGYLYQGSPRLLWVGKQGHLRGHAAPTVCYVINREVAELCLRFFDDEMTRYRPDDYFTFEAHMQWWLMDRGAQAYIPNRHYGEHGSKPQTEHRRNSWRRGGRHHADNLAAPLAFMPQYAEGRYYQFLRVRIGYWLLGWVRFFFGRWIIHTNAHKNTYWEIARMQVIGICRLVPLPLVLWRHVIGRL
jgi:hypothetical protein